MKDRSQTQLKMTNRRIGHRAESEVITILLAVCELIDDEGNQTNAVYLILLRYVLFYHRIHSGPVHKRSTVRTVPARVKEQMRA